MTGIAWGRGLALGVVAVTAVGAAVPAAATKMVATYGGTVRQGQDAGNLFGGGSLTGQRYEAVFTYDTSGFSRNLSGNTYEILNRVAGEYAITINGRTVRDSTSLIVGLRDGQAPGSLNIYDRISYESENIFSTGTQGLTLTSVDQTNFVTGLSPEQSISHTTSRSTLIDEGVFGYANGSRLYLDSTTLTISPVAVVPEPAGWALMLVGFATIGGALRIRRRRVAFA